MPILWPIIVPYLIWIFFIDKSPIQGGRASDWIRKSRYWVWFAGYYPVRSVYIIQCQIYLRSLANYILFHVVA